MRHTRPILAILASMALHGCTADDMHQQEERLVVEGWIDDGGYPDVYLTTSVAITKEYQHLDSLDKHVARWAKVTVSDGEQEVVLTGLYNNQLFPPYHYTTGRLRGRSGGTYRLTVDWRGHHAEAVTTIPERAEVDTFLVERCADSDTLYSLKARFADPTSTTDYYKAFVRVRGHSNNYLSPYLSTFNDKVLDGSAMTEVAIYRGEMMKDENFSPFFTKGSVVDVKFARMDEQSYLFWEGYEKAVSISRNPLFPVAENIKGNVKGALGSWCGYGATVYTLHIGQTEGER